MKNTVYRITGFLGLALLATIQDARAQEPVLASIPFQFTAGQMTLPAGEYKVQRMNDDSSALLVRSTDGNEATIVMTFAASVNAPQTQKIGRAHV